MRKRPFLLLACMLLAGILAQRDRVWVLYALPFFVGWCILRREEGSRRCLLLVLSVSLFAAGALRMGSEQRFRDGYLPELEDGQELRLVGEVARVEEKSALAYVYLTNCVLSPHKAGNDVLAYVKEQKVSVGQVLLVRGKVALFEGPPNEGGFDSAKFYQSQKIDFGLRVTEIEHRVSEGRYWRALNALRGKLSESIAACGAADGVLAAMLLGEKGGLDAEVKELYQQAGISHILAISGLHVTLLGIGLYRLLRRAGLRYLSAGGITGAFMLCYGAMTGGSVPTRRAIGMLLVLLVADMVGRGYDMLSALGLLCIVLLWENPFLVAYSGFWFSVLAVLGVGIVGPVIADWALPQKAEEQRGKDIRERLKLRARTFAHQMLESFGIQLATLPLVAYHYYEVPVYALLLNTVVLALVKYLLGIGCAAAFAGMWSARAGRLFMAPCNVILWLYEKLCGLALSGPCAQLVTGCPRPWQLAAYYAALAFVLFVMHGMRVRGRASGEQKSEGGKPAVCRAAGLALVTFGLFVLLTVRPPEGFEIDVLDVGQGDGIFFRTADGKAMFIDGGSSSVSSVGKYRILPFFKYNGVRKISFWFVSHTDEDHVSGLVELLESGYPVERLVFAKAVRGEGKTVELAELAKRRGTEVLYLEAGDVIASKTTILRCLYPGGDGIKQENKSDVNGLSLVLQLEYGGFKGLFTGDIPAEAEKVLLRENRIVPVDLYKAAHHGSRYSNGSDFLQALQPEVSVVSCGKNNRYGHPGEEAISHMEAAGSLVYRTDRGGEIMLSLERGKLKIEEFCIQ